MGTSKCLIRFILIFFVIVAGPYALMAQTNPQDSTEVSILVKRGLIKDTAYQNYASGEFTPGRGFDLVRCQVTKHGRIIWEETGISWVVMISSGIEP